MRSVQEWTGEPDPADTQPTRGPIPAPNQKKAQMLIAEDHRANAFLTISQVRPISTLTFILKRRKGCVWIDELSELHHHLLIPKSSVSLWLLSRLRTKSMRQRPRLSNSLKRKLTMAPTRPFRLRDASLSLLFCLHVPIYVSLVLPVRRHFSCAYHFATVLLSDSGLSSLGSPLSILKGIPSP